MYRMRSWSVRHARALKKLYASVERMLMALEPLIRRIGYRRLDRPMLRVGTHQPA